MRSNQTLIYKFNQRQIISYYVSGSEISRRNIIVYAKPLVIHRGVDNILEFKILDQNQKNVDITSKEITIRLISSDGTTQLLQKTLTPIYSATGLTSLQLTSADIEYIAPQQCYYSLSVNENNKNMPIYVNQGADAKGVIIIKDSILPSQVLSRVVSIPTHIKPSINQPRTYFSSVIPLYGEHILTIQQWLENFTGSIQFQGSTLADFSLFYDITESVLYDNITDTIGTTLIGYHPYVRVKIVNNGTLPELSNGELNGDVIQLLAR